MLLLIASGHAQSLPAKKTPGPQQRTSPLARNPKAAANFYRQGKAALDRRDYNKALWLLKQAVERDGPKVEYRIALSDAHYKWAEQLRWGRDYENAIRHYRIAYEIDKLHRRTRTHIDLHDIGKSYFDNSQIDLALPQWQQALLLSQELRDRGWEAHLLRDIGMVYDHLGQYEQALVYYQQGLPIFQELKQPQDEADCLKAIARIHKHMGRYERALEYYQRALEKDKKLSERASTLYGISSVYGSLGQKDQAEQFYQRAINTNRNVKGDRFALSDIAALHYSRHDYSTALQYYLQALALYREMGKRGAEADTLRSIGWSHLQLKNTHTAIDFFQQALSIYQRTENWKGKADILIALGVAHNVSGKFDNSLLTYLQALGIYREMKNLEDEARTLVCIMHLYRTWRKPTLASFYGKQAVNVYQSIRADIQGLDKELLRSYLQSNEKTYRTLADLLIEQGRIPEAEQVLAMLKEDEFFEFVRRDDKIAKGLLSQVEPNSVEEKFLKEYDAIAEQVTKLGTEYSALEAERKKAPPGKFPKQARLDEVSAQLASAKKSFELFLKTLETEFGKSNVRVKEVESGLQKDLLKWNVPGTVVISTITGAERLNVFITTERTQRAHQMDVPAAELNKLIGEFRLAVADKTARMDPRPAGQKLYDLLIKPLEGDLEGACAKTILWSLDGALRYVPVSALYDKDKGYLAERYANTIITLASRTNLGQKPATENRTVLGLGVSKEFENFPPLLAVPEELRGIVREETETTGVLGGKRLLDEQFDKKAFRDYMGRYPLVHIASHFDLRVGNINDSFLLLGAGSKEERQLTLTELHEIRNTIFSGVELLTLSACETAQGGTGSGGEEIEGFGKIAQDLGAQSVLATLWPVADPSTRDLMVGFYQRMEGENASGKAEALRQAQLALLRGEVASPEAAALRSTRVREAPGAQPDKPQLPYDKEKPYAHPYFWAPFILIGNWR